MRTRQTMWHNHICISLTTSLPPLFYCKINNFFLCLLFFAQEKFIKNFIIRKRISSRCLHSPPFARSRWHSVTCYFLFCEHQINTLSSTQPSSPLEWTLCIAKPVRKFIWKIWKNPYSSSDFGDSQEVVSLLPLSKKSEEKSERKSESKTLEGVHWANKRK